MLLSYLHLLRVVAAMAEYATLCVRKIAITASPNDIERFLAAKIPDGDPVVNSLVNDANGVFKTATVTFKGRNKAACEATIRALKSSSGSPLQDEAGIVSDLDFDSEFLGLTELANGCVQDEEPYFEYV